MSSRFSDMSRENRSPGIPATSLIATIVAIVGGVVALHIIKFDATSYLARSLLDSLHLPGFCIVTVLLGCLMLRRLPLSAALPVTLLLSLVLGIAAEWAQFFGARDASFKDLWHDALGTIAGLVIVTAVARPRIGAFTHTGHRWLHLAAVVCLLATWIPSALITANIANRWLSVPVLLSFDAGWESSVHREWPETALQITDAPANWPLPGPKVGVLRPENAQYPGLIFDPYPDWRNFDAISFLAVSTTGRAETVSLRIHDKRYRFPDPDRFEHALVISPRLQRFRIPLAEIRAGSGNRELDLSAIVELRIRVLNPSPGFGITIDDIRLENQYHSPPLNSGNPH